jgi:membrane protein
LDAPTAIVRRIYRFFTETLWSIDSRVLRWPLRFGLGLLRILALLVERVLGGRYALRASGLTYTTLLSLVPFLALAFSVAKGFGAQELLVPLIKTYLVAGQAEIAESVLSYVEQTNVKALGTVGLVGILITVVLLFASVENAFNEIWGVARPRSWARRFANYLSATIVFPILLLAASGLTATLASSALQTQLEVVLPLLQLGRYFAVWVAFSFLYVFLPNIRVRLIPALFGGVIAGSAWLLAQWGYLHFQVGVARYNAIYGTFAALPIFLVWLYLSWVIVLLGAELVHAVHRVHGETLERRALPLSPRDRKRLALRLAAAEAARLDAGHPPLSESELLQQFDGVSAGQARPVLDGLDRSGVLQALELESGELTHVLRHSPDRLRLAELLEAFDRQDRPERALPASPVDDCLQAFDEALRRHPSNKSLRELSGD